MSTPRQFVLTVAAQSALPAWVPTTIGESAKLTTVNRADDAMKKGIWSGDGSGAHLTSYSGGAYNPYYGVNGCTMIHGGGHAAWNDNSVFIFDYDDLTYKRISGPTELASVQAYQDIITTLSGYPDDQSNPREYAPGVPGSAHTYANQVVLPPALCGDSQGGFLQPVANGISTSVSRSTGVAHMIGLTGRTWSRWSTNHTPYSVSGGACVLDTTRNKVWYIQAENSVGAYLDLTASSGTWGFSGAYSKPGTNSYGDSLSAAYHAANDLVVFCTCQNGGGAGQSFWYFRGDQSVSDRTQATISSGALPDGRFGGGSLMYVPELGKLVYWTKQDQDAYYEITVPAVPSNPWTWVRRAMTGDLPSASTYSVNVHKRVDYSSKLKSMVMVLGQTLNQYNFGNIVYAVRISPS